MIALIITCIALFVYALCADKRVRQYQTEINRLRKELDKHELGV